MLDEYAFQVRDGEVFSISYIHSVNLSKVIEIFEIRQGKIVLTALEFETFGAGMPTELEPGQQLTLLPGGKMRIDGFERVLEELSFLIGQNTEHALRVGNREVTLEPGPVMISISEYSTLK